MLTSPMNGVLKSVAQQLHCHSKELTFAVARHKESCTYHHFEYTRTVKEPQNLLCYHEILLRIWVEAKVTHLQSKAQKNSKQNDIPILAGLCLIFLAQKK